MKFLQLHLLVLGLLLILLLGFEARVEVLLKLRDLLANTGLILLRILDLGMEVGKLVLVGPRPAPGRSATTAEATRTRTTEAAGRPAGRRGGPE